MPKDALTYLHIANELDEKLRGSKIERICMPDKDSVIFVLRQNHGGDRRQFKLLFSINPNCSRVGIIDNSVDNPLSAFSFLMHLRKRINGGTISKIDTVNHERIYRVYITACDELGYAHDFILYGEMMGRYANLILTNENGIITDCMRHISIDEGQKHALIPGIKYEFPPVPEGKISPDECDKLVAILKNFDGGRLADYLMERVYGFAPISMRQIVYSAYGSLSPSPDTVKSMPSAFINALSRANHTFAPCTVKQNGAIVDFYPFAYTHLDVEFTPTQSLYGAVELYYSQKVSSNFSTGKITKLASSVRSAIKKLEKSLAILSDRIIESQDFEYDRVKGELITANIYKIRQGDNIITVDNYYTGEKENIILDATLSPQKNAQKYYRSYTKKKTALTKSQEMIDATTEKIDYLDTILTSLACCEDESSIAQIKSELVAIGVLKHAGVKKKNKPARPIEFIVDGYSVAIGKNNYQNDALVRSSEGGWLWLHTQKIHGSHGIIKATNVPQDTINKVASFVAYYSKASQSANVPVDYTLIKFVKKPAGALPGKVIYTHQQTVNVTPKKPEL